MAGPGTPEQGAGQEPNLPLGGLPFEQAAYEQLSATELGIEELQSRLESSAGGQDAISVDIFVTVSW